MSMKRVVLVGVGGRSVMYRDAAAFGYPKSARLVGLCDINPGRLALAQAALKARKLDVPGCAPAGFETLIEREKANLVVVTSRDSTHDDFIVRAMRAGCDVITEKPMTIDVDRCQRILDAIDETGRSLRVTFNYRYSPPRTQVKELLQSGVIGRVLSVEFKWMLDTSHGADYFRRWHRNKENSGGLMVHKATHHFDLVNWWINSVPARVSAIGARRFYTPEQAERYGFTRRSERCLDCPEANRCPFFIDIRGGGLRELYYDHEQHDGYFRDRCVFSSRIDIEDTMNVAVEYRNGVTMSYSLNAFSPWEGYHIVFNGTKGRLEHVTKESSYINGDGRIPGETTLGTMINVMPHFTHGYFVPVRHGEGGHGGGDTRLLDDLFLPKPPPDPLKRRADHRGGAWSILTGVAANISMKESRIVSISELVPGLELPEYPDESKQDTPIRLREFIQDFEASAVLPRSGPISRARPPARATAFTPMKTSGGFMNVWPATSKDGVIYLRATYRARRAGRQVLHFGADGPSKVWVNGKAVGVYPDLTNPASPDTRRAEVTLRSGSNDLLVALDTHGGKAWGIYARFDAE